MGFVDLESMRPIEPVPGCRLRAPSGQHLMLSELQVDADAEIPMHSLLGQCFRRFEVPPHRLHCNATAASGDAMTVGQRRSF